MPQFYTRRGRLTPYALACGYAERFTRPDRISITLWQEHGVFHVRATDAAARRLEWLSFTSLAAAREAFDAARRAAAADRKE